MKPYFQVLENKNYLHLVYLLAEKHNAFSLAAARELSGLAKRHSKLKKPVVVSSAHPRMFCAGGDMSHYASLRSKSDGVKVNLEITKCLKAFGAWPTVKLALINGDVLGGGMEWLARFDFRWCVSGVMLSFWQKRIGLTPGWGGGQLWAERLGEARLRSLLLEARLLDAHSALHLGLVDRVVTSWTWRGDLELWAQSQASGVEPEILGLSSKNERTVFNKLWLSGVHKAALAKWKARGS